MASGYGGLRPRQTRLPPTRFERILRLVDRLEPPPPGCVTGATCATRRAYSLAASTLPRLGPHPSESSPPRPPASRPSSRIASRAVASAATCAFTWRAAREPSRPEGLLRVRAWPSFPTVLGESVCSRSGRTLSPELPFDQRPTRTEKSGMYGMTGRGAPKKRPPRLSCPLARVASVAERGRGGGRVVLVLARS